MALVVLLLLLAAVLAVLGIITALAGISALRSAPEENRSRIAPTVLFVLATILEIVPLGLMAFLWHKGAFS